ncbi:unnamed protein product [Angiostrongylus costaricensis]|uniref:Ovule protein n=1 Tax=Angiostrongylus costaricensis TaxID=334426 RepID=A0A0R3PSQ7_ANGCS|nr:unnamed protein product [Angiostrongylus costaricensis]
MGIEASQIKCDYFASLISNTSFYYQILRFYTYNTERVNDGWVLWRLGSCAHESVILQVHCGFPDKE